MCQKYQGAIKKQQCKLKYGEILKLKKKPCLSYVAFRNGFHESEHDVT